jgi:hypothetical protein
MGNTLKLKYRKYLGEFHLRQNRGARRTRDTEKRKTYRAEWAYAKNMGGIDTFASIEEAEKFAKRIYKSKTWNKIWEENFRSWQTADVGSRKPMIVAAQRDSKRLGGYTDGQRVTLYKNGLDKYTLLHELAHCLGHMHHGRSFRKTVLALVGTFLGADHKKELKRCFKEQGLKYGDARKPKTFEQWQKSYTHMMLLRHRQRQAK